MQGPRAVAISLVAVALGGCARRGKPDEARPDETAEAEAKKKPKQSEPDPCGAGAKPPTWTIERFAKKEPKIDQAWPAFVSGCAPVGKALSSPFASDAKASREDLEKQWKEAKAEPSPFNLESWELTEACEPALVSASLVSVACSSSQYTGGAHGMYGTVGRSFLIEGRKVRELKLEELFDAKKGWKKALGERVAKKVNEEKKKRTGVSADPVTGVDVEAQLGAFVLEQATIELYFAPYALGSYAEGEFVASLSYAELDDLVAKGGPLSGLPRRK